MTKRQRKHKKRLAVLAQKCTTAPGWLRRRLVQIAAGKSDFVFRTEDLNRAFRGCRYPSKAASAVLRALCNLVDDGLLRNVPGGCQLTTTAWLKRLNASSEEVRP